jgi:DNA helicase IV
MDRRHGPRAVLDHGLLCSTLSPAYAVEPFTPPPPDPKVRFIDMPETAAERADVAPSKDLEAEQAYIHFAYDCLEEMRRTVEILMATDAGVNAAAREALQEMFAARLVDLESDQALCFGRIDRLDGDRYYIGRRHVRDEEGDPVVIDWRAPVAEAFYQANAMDPWELERRRSFRMEGSKLLEIEDEVFAELAAARRRGGDIPATLVRAGDALMAELGRERTGRMRDVVATIQAEQDRVIRLPSDGVVVVQGAPGTGKTAVGLHRAAFILYRMREARARGGVLVVGPNRAFMRYIERVLPSLGETTVVQSPVDALASVHVRTDDESAVLRLKGDPRMAEVIARAVRQRTRPDAARRELRVRGRRVSLSEDECRALVDRAFATGLPYREARDVFVSSVASALAGHGAGIGATSRDIEEIRTDLVRDPGFRALVDRGWPSASAADVVRDLLASRRALVRAAEGVLTDGEIGALVRRATRRGADERWTRGDVALVDEAQWRIAGVPRTYTHVIVDEVQDLSPMEVRMVGRRAATGAMTLLGDLAQSIAEWSYSNWDELLSHLPARRGAATVGHGAVVQTLTVGYRVPSQMIELAARLLPQIAPDLEPPVAIRSGDEDPRFVKVPDGRLIHEAVREMRDAARRDGSVGVIVPESLRHDLEGGARAGRIEFDGADWGRGRKLTIMSAREAKGLEFDHVLLIEPSVLLAEGVRGRRELYVALTRATRTLAVVFTGELPAELNRPLAA